MKSSWITPDEHTRHEPQPANNLKKYEIKHTPNNIDILTLMIWVNDKM